MKSKLIVLLLFGHLTSAFCQDGFLESYSQLAYWRVGSKLEVLIVLHGGPAVHHEYLRPELDGLSKNATVIYYDQRGCGKSERADSYTWQDHVKDLHRLITTLAPKKKYFWSALHGGVCWQYFIRRSIHRMLKESY